MVEGLKNQNVIYRTLPASPFVQHVHPKPGVALRVTNALQNDDVQYQHDAPDRLDSQLHHRHAEHRREECRCAHWPCPQPVFACLPQQNGFAQWLFRLCHRPGLLTLHRTESGLKLPRPFHQKKLRWQGYHL